MTEPPGAPAPPDDLPGLDVDDEDDDVVDVGLSPEGALRLWDVLEAARAHQIAPWAPVVNRSMDDKADLRDLNDLRRMLASNRFVRPLYEARLAAQLGE